VHETNPDVKILSFEQALQALETIVQRLESGSVPLEESLAIYERGEALKSHCDTLLKQAEVRIEKITVGADGKATGTVPLDAGA
jgi:exodeoxyribonuclease VII small subunit